MSSLYNRIELLCKERGLNVTEMCRKSGASRGSLTDLKMGRTNGLNSATLNKIAVYFDVTVDYLLGRESVDGAITRAILATAEKENPADQKAGGLRGAGYDLLTPENKRMIDSLIAKLLESQSGE